MHLNFVCCFRSHMYNIHFYNNIYIYLLYIYIYREREHYNSSQKHEYIYMYIYATCVLFVKTCESAYSRPYRIP